jgi:hypothetical protein
MICIWSSQEWATPIDIECEGNICSPTTTEDGARRSAQDSAIQIIQRRNWSTTDEAMEPTESTEPTRMSLTRLKHIKVKEPTRVPPTCIGCEDDLIKKTQQWSQQDCLQQRNTGTESMRLPSTSAMQERSQQDCLQRA